MACNRTPNDMPSYTGLLWEIPGGISRLGNTALSNTPQVGNTGKYWEILILDFNICIK